MKGNLSKKKGFLGELTDEALKSIADIIGLNIKTETQEELEKLRKELETQKIDLTKYQTITEATVALGEKEDVGNKTNEIKPLFGVSEDKYPSEKAIVDYVGNTSEICTPCGSNLVNGVNDCWDYTTNRCSDIETKIGDMSKLNYTESPPSNLVDAMNDSRKYTTDRYVAIKGDVGYLETLTTEDVTCTVAAINEVNAKIGDIDTALDSILALQNTLIGGDNT